MPRAISGWRVGRSFIGNVDTEELVELDFNIGTREAIEIAGVLGAIGISAATAGATIGPVVGEQSLHLEDGTIETPGTTGADADQFNNDSEIIFNQVANLIAWDGTTEGGVTIDISPSGLVTFPRPILSPINLTHRADNAGAALDAGYTLLIYYRYVELNNAELALEFNRRRR